MSRKILRKHLYNEKLKEKTEIRLKMSRYIENPDKNAINDITAAAERDKWIKGRTKSKKSYLSHRKVTHGK